MRADIYIKYEVLVLSRVRLSAPPWSVRGVLQARMLEWVATPISRGSSRLGDRTWVSCIAGRFSTI